jgi:stage II sporulation protein AB (anti-sigma F factor)
MKIKNEMTLTVKAISENESFVRSSVAAFCLPINPTIDEITEIKTAVSEAVTNCVVHAYPNKIGDIVVKVKLTESDVNISVTDYGIGIDNLEKAIEPFFTTKPNDERSGMGFTVIESFMDSFKLERNKGKGITVYMTKHIGGEKLALVGENNAVC